MTHDDSILVNESRWEKEENPFCPLKAKKYAKGGEMKKKKR